MNSEREALRRAFLEAAGLGAARREALPGDASTRRYERLHPLAGPSLILMDQAPSLETHPCPADADAAARAALGYNALYRLAAGRIDAFVACAGYLRGRGLSAPAVLAADHDLGLAVLEDLGDDLFARRIEAGADEGALYDAAIDVLVALHAQTPPDVLQADGFTWPLLTYDALALRTGSAVFVDWLPALHTELTFDAAAKAEWDALWAPVLARAEAMATVFCHRDYHAENLMWLPDRTGPARVGLIDFQDAVRAHPAWDLSMLLHDARREITPEREAACLARYLAARPEVEAKAFLADFRALGALNILRMLGLFARLAVRDGKPRYLALMPRLWRYLDRCLAGGAPPGLAEWLERRAPISARGG